MKRKVIFTKNANEVIIYIGVSHTEEISKQYLKKIQIRTECNYNNVFRNYVKIFNQVTTDFSIRAHSHTHSHHVPSHLRKSVSTGLFNYVTECTQANIYI